MTKRRPTVSRHPERMADGHIVLDRGPNDPPWFIMRDWMVRVDERLDRLDERFDRIELRLDRVESRLDNMDARFERLGLDISAVNASVKELAVIVGGIDRRLYSVEGKVDDLVAWKHRIWGVVIALGGLSGVIAFVTSLLATHVVG